jgi:hypothetical protein
MRFVGSRRELVEMLVDLVGIKGRLIIDATRTIELLDASFPGLEERGILSLDIPSRWWRGNPDEWVGIRSEELDADFAL